MKTKILIINFLFCHFLYSQIMLPSSGKDDWTILQDAHMWIGYKYSDEEAEVTKRIGAMVTYDYEF